MTEWLPWIVGVGIPVIGGLITIWWRVESKNSKAHGDLHEKIDDLKDMIVDIWKHIGPKRRD